MVPAGQSVIALADGRRRLQYGLVPVLGMASNLQADVVDSGFDPWMPFVEHAGRGHLSFDSIIPLVADL